MTRASISVVLVTLVGAASAQPKPAPAPATPKPADEVVRRLEEITSKASGATSATPAFAFTGNLTLSPPGTLDEARMGFPDTSLADPKKTLVAVPDADTAWISTYLGEYSQCGKAGCAKSTPDGWVRAIALFERSGGTWQPIAWSITPSIHSSAQADAMDEGVMPDPLTDSVGLPVAEVVSQFKTSLADPKAFAASFADRKDVVLMGSELGERYVGSQAKATIGKWGFAFTIHDGVRAGVSKSGNVVWVAGNVDGKQLKRPKAKPLTFRMFALYEKIANQWKLVQVQFSTSV